MIDVITVHFHEDHWQVENLVDLRDFNVQQRHRLFEVLEYWLTVAKEIDQRERESEDISRE